MSNAEFRERIRAICGPAPTANRPIVRGSSDRGYAPSVIEAMMHGKLVIIDNNAGTITQPKEAA